MLEILVNTEISPGKIHKSFNKTVEQLSNGNFTSAEVKKMSNYGLYRAKIDYENRLLFKFGRHNNQTCLLILEVIFNHDYHKSRFLRGANIDESKMVRLNDTKEIPNDDIEPVKYINKNHKSFHLLDKVLSFDDFQQQVLSTSLPQIIIGSAGSGKTALTLEKIKTLTGKVLYVTLSPYLAENSSKLFYSYNYENDNLDIDFFSYREFIESLSVPPGRELEYKAFENWFSRYRQATKLTDSHKTFEEFRGVITGLDISKEYLAREEYLNMGVKQSIFLNNQREQVYNLFEKYLNFLKENGYYDINILSHQWLDLCKPYYDYIVVDEVQDLTNIQLYILLKSVKKPGNFILCGDANQVVHPNFFSWSHLKTMFYEYEFGNSSTTILRANYRNSRNVSELANRLLKIRVARFGSIDKESNFLIDTSSDTSGSVIFVEDKKNNVPELNQKTKLSTNCAVLVMRNEDKAKARSVFQTPLLFSVQESKGLEYENIIIYNFLSENSAEFNELCNNVSQEELKSDELDYSRAKDKADKSSEVYKFFINSFYVAITRAVKNVYIVEQHKTHKIFNLLDVIDDIDHKKLKSSVSSSDEWKREARRLEKQGKTEQADAIRHQVLKTQTPDWEPIDYKAFQKLKKDALDPEMFNQKAKKLLYDFALAYNHHSVMYQLAKHKFKKAEKYEEDKNAIFRKHYPHYYNDNVKMVAQNVNKYGINYRDLFNFTPLHVAALAGAMKICDWLLKYGANPGLFDTFGKTPLQISLLQAFVDNHYAKLKIGSIYPLLISDSLRVQVDGQLIKIDPHKIEFFLVNLFIAVQSVILRKKRHYESMAIKFDDIINSLQDFPNIVLPEFRKRRQYLQPQLSKNEVESTNPYNKKLFVRIDRGHYILNPAMKIWVNEQWLAVDEIINMQDYSEQEVKDQAQEIHNKEMEETRLYFEKLREKQRRNQLRYMDDDEGWF